MKFCGEFCAGRLNLEKVGPTFSGFNLCQEPVCPSLTESFAEQTRGLSKYVASL